MPIACQHHCPHVPLLTNVTQLPQTCQIIPLSPSLSDALALDSVDHNIFAIQGSASRRVPAHGARLRSVEVHASGNFLILSNNVDNLLIGIREGNVFVAQKLDQIIPAMDTRIVGGDAMPYEICRHESLNNPPILVVHRLYKRPNDLL